MQNQRENKHTGEGTAGKPPQELPSPQKLRCFQDILDVVLSLSDEEWRTLTSDVPNTGTKLQFACLCTKIITSVCKSAIQSYLPTLIRVVGMEAVLKAEEKLKKKAESAFMSSSTSAAPSPGHSAESSPVDLSDLISIIVEDFVREVKMAMQRAICKVASYEASSWSRDWKTTCSRVAEEMFNILETKVEPSHREDPPVLREAQDKDTLHTKALTRKIIMVGLDVLSGSSAERADRRTSDRLIAATDKLKQMTSSSTSEEHLSIHEQKDKAQLPHEDVQQKATRAVSQVLLSSSGIWERNSRSSEMPSSLASETDLDSMLEAMAKAGFPTDLIQHHLDFTSRDIVSTIKSSMDVLSSTGHSSKKKTTKDSGVFSILNHAFHRINERLKVFFRVTEKLVKVGRATEPSSNITQASETLVAKPVNRAKSQAPSVNTDFQKDDLTVGCTNDGTGGIVRLHHPDVSHTESHIPTVHSVSQLDNLTVTCTNSIVSEIVQLYHSDESSECEASVGDKDKVEIHDIFQGLEELVRTSGPSSKTSSSDKDLGECEDVSLPKLDAFKVDPEHGRTSACSSLESLFSARFKSEATQTVCDILLKTGEELSISGSTQSFKSSSSPAVFLPSAAASSFYTEAQSAASDIVTNFLKKLRKCCLSAPSDNACSSTRPAAKQKKDVPSASQSIYRGVHKKIWRFLLGLRKPFPEKRRIFPQDQPPVGAELESKTQTILPRFQLNLDSCTDEVIYKVVELFKSELLLSSSSKVTLHVSASLPEHPSVNLKTVKPKGFLTEAAQLVSDVLTRRLSSQTSSDESRQHFLDSSREIFGCSASSTDVEDAAVTIAETVVDALDRYVESKHSALTAVNSSSDTLSCLDALSQISVSNISEEPNTSKKINYSNPFFVFRKVKDLLNDLLLREQRTDPSVAATKTKRSALGMSQATPITSHHSESPVGSKTAPLERNPDHEVGAIFETPDSAAETIAVTQPRSVEQPASEMTQLDHLIPDEIMQSHADRLTNFTTDVLRNTAEPSHVRKRFSDSVLETSWVRSCLLRDPDQVPSTLVYVFVDDSVKSLLLHLLSLNPTTSHAADLSVSSTSTARQLRGSSADFYDQNSNELAGFTDVENRFTGSQSKMENPLSLLVKSEHSERNHDSVLDVKPVGESPTASSIAGTSMVGETLEILSVSSQEYESYTSSSSPVNESCSLDPKPVAVKKRSRGFRFVVAKKAPLINIGLKKSNKLCPAGLVSDSHQYPSTSGNLQESSQRESKVSMTPFKKTRQRLSRIFSAVRRALPNPFQCMTRPS